MRRVLDAEHTPKFLAWKARLDRIRSRDKADGLQFDPIPRYGRPLLGWETGVPDYAETPYRALTERDKQIVSLLFQQGKRQREVAGLVGVSQQTVSLVQTLFVAKCEVPSIEEYKNQDYEE